MRSRNLKVAFVTLAVLIIGLAATAADRGAREETKSQKDPSREVRPPYRNPNAGGGPDAFGYRYADSNEPGGPVFDWIDISTTGTPVYFPEDWDDDYAFPIEIGFPFTFYGQTFTQAAVGTNGHVWFEDAYLGLGNVCVPGEVDYDVTENFIAAYWTDLITWPADAFAVLAPGTVYTETLGEPGSRRFVVMFDRVGFYDCAGGEEAPSNMLLDEMGISFEIILNEADHSILLQYLSPWAYCEGEDYGAAAVVGIQRDSTLGLAYSCYEPVLEDNLAVLFSLGEPFTPDVTFLDDLGRSELCIQKSNGMYQWTNADGSVYTGTGVVANGGTAFWTLPEDPTYIYATYDSRRKRARAYFTNSDDAVYNSLVDRNTANNSECGSLIPVEPPPVY
ncbi:MAG: hypothetical protein AB1347_05615 [Acidobacteriota bacterium]